MHSTHTQGMRGGSGVGGRWRCKIIVTTSHSPPSTLTGTENSVDQMLGTPVCDWDWGGRGAVVGKCGGEGGIWCNANRRVPGGSKGDTEGACVSLPNHCVALWGQADTRRFGGGETRTYRGRTTKRERWKKRRRGGEQTDNHRRPQATLIRMQTSTSHIYTTLSLLYFPPDTAESHCCCLTSSGIKQLMMIALIRPPTQISVAGGGSG